MPEPGWLERVKFVQKHPVVLAFVHTHSKSLPGDFDVCTRLYAAVDGSTITVRVFWRNPALQATENRNEALLQSSLGRNR